jgi:hypothetical protein
VLAAQIGGLGSRFGSFSPPMIRCSVHLFLCIVRSQWRGLYSSSGLNGGAPHDTQ